jgi:hypothetical protein
MDKDPEIDPDTDKRDTTLGEDLAQTSVQEWLTIGGVGMGTHQARTLLRQLLRMGTTGTETDAVNVQNQAIETWHGTRAD